MRESLFKKSPISHSHAKLLFSVFGWLIERHGKPHVPSVPSPIKAHQTILTRRWTSSEIANVQDWALKNFSELKKKAGMDKWAIQIAPIINGKSQFEYLYAEKNWNPAAIDPYYIDTYGRAVITFDPQACYQAGAFAARILTKLAEIQVLNFVPYEEIDLEKGAMIILASAAYSGQGFYLLPKAEAIAKQLSARASVALSTDIIETSLIFNSCLALLVLNRTPEQIIATYGSLLDPVLRQKIRSMCRQIERMEPELLSLRTQLSPKRTLEQALPWKQVS
jgi:hypothetical protein